MQRKWKYRVEKIKVSVFANAEEKVTVQREALDRLGMEGWELVNVVMAVNHESSPTYYLKRPY